MNLTRNDTKSVLSWGVGGFVAAAMYQLTSIWVRQRTNTGELGPETEALGDDPELFSLFCQLQEHCKLSHAAFRQSVNDADRLVFLHLQLQNNEIKPSLKDRTVAFLHFKSAVRNMEALFEAAQLHPLPRVPVEVHRLYVLIFTCLENHWNSILHTTQVIHDI